MSMTLHNRTQGMTVIGQTGFGKTAFLHNLILDDLRSGTSAIVFDVHGDLTEDVLQSLPDGTENKVSVLSVDENYPFGLNLYELPTSTRNIESDRAIDTIITIFRKLWGDERAFYPRVEYVLRNTGRTIQSNNGYTMAEIPYLFHNQTLLNHLLKNVNNPAVHLFWQDYWERRPFDKTALIESTVNKFDQFLSSEIMRLIVGQGHTSVNFSDFLLHEGQLLLIHLPIGELGEIRSDFLGIMLLSLLTNAMYQRPQNLRVPIHLYLDEYQRFATPGSAALLREGRKFNVGTTVALQSLHALDAENQSAVLQTGTLVFFQVIGGMDAEILSKQLKVKQPPVEQVPKMRMEPNIKEWDEEVWTDGEAERIFNTYTSEKLSELGEQWDNAKERVKRFEFALDHAVNTYERVNGMYWVGVSVEDSYHATEMKGLLNGELPTPHPSGRQHRWEEVWLADTKEPDQPRIYHWLLLYLPDVAKDIYRSCPNAGIANYMIWLRSTAKRLIEEREQAKKAYEDEELAYKAERERLYKEHYVKVHHKEQNGWIPVKTEEVRATTQIRNYARRGPTYFEGSSLIQREQQIYDMIDGSPRMFSDLWNEMQANLATLPPYHYYMQTINEQKEIIESQLISEKPPNPQPNGAEKAEKIRTRSLQKFGTPADQVRQSLIDRISPFMGRSEEKSPEEGKTGELAKQNKPKPKAPISGAKPFE